MLRLRTQSNVYLTVRWQPPATGETDSRIRVTVNGGAEFTAFTVPGGAAVGLSLGEESYGSPTITWTKGTDDTLTVMVSKKKGLEGTWQPLA